jgi:hypothetical protein
MLINLHILPTISTHYLITTSHVYAKSYHHNGKGFLWQKISSQKHIFSPQSNLCGDFFNRH